MSDIQQEFGIHAMNFTIHGVESATYYQDKEYIEFTSEKDIEAIISYLFNLNLSDFTISDQRKANKRFYGEVLTYKGLINLYHSGRGYNKETVHVEMKGSAFESAELNLTDIDIRRVINSIANPECPCPWSKATIKELHIYVDDKQLLLNFDQLQQLAITHSVKTHCRPVLFPGKSDTDARSFAYGSRPKRYTLYESGRHRYGKEAAEFKGIDTEFLDYIRVELQLSGEYAAEALARYVAGESLPSIHGSYYSDAVVFLSPSRQKNKARHNPLPAWSQFLAEAGEAPLKPPRKPPTVEGHLAQLTQHIKRLESLYGPKFIADHLRHHVEELEMKSLEF